MTVAGYGVVLGMLAFTVWALLRVSGICARIGDHKGAQSCAYFAGIAWVGMVWAVFNLVVELSERGL